MNLATGANLSRVRQVQQIEGHCNREVNRGDRSDARAVPTHAGFQKRILATVPDFFSGFFPRQSAAAEFLPAKAPGDGSAASRRSPESAAPSAQPKTPQRPCLAGGLATNVHKSPFASPPLRRRFATGDEGGCRLHGSCFRQLLSPPVPFAPRPTFCLCRQTCRPAHRPCEPARLFPPANPFARLRTNLKKLEANHLKISP